jgi:hypothetical protein
LILDALGSFSVTLQVQFSDIGSLDRQNWPFRCSSLLPYSFGKLPKKPQRGLRSKVSPKNATILYLATPFLCFNQ